MGVNFNPKKAEVRTANQPTASKNPSNSQTKFKTKICGAVAPNYEYGVPPTEQPYMVPASPSGMPNTSGLPKNNPNVNDTEDPLTKLYNERDNALKELTDACQSYYQKHSDYIEAEKKYFDAKIAKKDTSILKKEYEDAKTACQEAETTKNDAQTKYDDIVQKINNLENASEE